MKKWPRSSKKGARAGSGLMPERDVPRIDMGLCLWYLFI